MTSPHVHARDRFDGEQWAGPGAVLLDDQGRGSGPAECSSPDGTGCGNPTVAVLTPALVDGATSFMGYRESAQDTPARATDAVVASLTRHGIGLVRDDGSTYEALYRARVRAPGLVVLGGPILTEQTPRHESERQASSADDVRRSVAAAAVEGSTWITVRTDSGDFLAGVVECAREHGIRVAVRTQGLGATEAGRAGAALVTGVAGLSPVPRGGSAADLLTGWAEASPTASRDHARAIAGEGIAISSGLIALRREAFVKEALAAPLLEELIPVFPHTQYLLEMRRSGGYLMGKRQLARHAGLVEPTARQRTTMLLGWDRMLSALADFAGAGGTVLPASHAPRLAVVPGLALKEELTLLGVVLGTESALRLAVGAARRFLGAGTDAPWGAVGAPMPVLVADDSRERLAPVQLRRIATGSVVAA
jgi:hypothetical protein